MKKLAIGILSCMVITVLFVGHGITGNKEKRGGKSGSGFGERYKNKIYGTVEQIPESVVGVWIVDGKEVHVTDSTVIDQEYGEPAVGGYVEIKGRYDGDTFTAREIEVKRKRKDGRGSRRDSEKGRRNEKRIYGAVEKIPQEVLGVWVVGGKEVLDLPRLGHGRF